MRIEIPKNNRMSMTGKSIIDALQNRSMSTIDLLVRESIQNSLDAYINNSKYKKVVVSFNIGNFNSRNLNNHLDLLGKELDKKYKNGTYEYISIEDKNTVGLNGKIDEIGSDNKYGNFQKLVYEIAKPQTQDDAGGSWGYGKTIYFRVGIGLVVFYTRYNDENQGYKQRLACTYIEDETKYDSLLRNIKAEDNRGIAWLGKCAENGSTTVPEENEDYIRRFLTIFNIEPYADEETGTKIIIPYIDRTKLLEDINEKKDISSSTYYYWKNSFEDTLRNSILMWYSPRINSLDYNRIYQKPYLQVYINNKAVIPSNTFFYKIINSMYKYAIRNNSNSLNDKVMYQQDIENIDTLYIKSIKYSRLDGIAGTIVFTKVNKNAFEEYLPYTYIGQENISSIGNRPIICFTRKPGMIIDYQQSNEWADSIASTDVDEFLIGIFVLNSNAYIDSKYSLEKYVRETEMADHSSWKDIKIDNISSGRIIGSICKNTKNIINRTFEDEIGQVTPKRKIGISQKLGKIFLPTTGFGTRPITGMNKIKSKKLRPPKNKDATFVFNETGYYSQKGINMEWTLKIHDCIVIIEPLISTESGYKEKKFWIDTMDMPFPFSFNSLVITEIFENNSKKNKLVDSLHIAGNLELFGIEIKILNEEEQGFSKIMIKSRKDVIYTIKGTLNLQAYDKRFAGSLKMRKEEKNEGSTILSEAN